MTNPTPHGQVPEALRLAHIFDNPLPPEWRDMVAAAAELRRQHTRIAELEAQIEALSGVQALSAAPAGWKLVPVEPTKEMLLAGSSDLRLGDCIGTLVRAAECWKAMLAASPTPPAEQTFITPETGNSVSANGAAITSESGTPPAEQQAAKVAPAIGDELRDALVAVSAAIAEQDDRTAQKMIREILEASPAPPAEQPTQPGAVYAELPQPDSWFHFTPQYWGNKLRDFADRTHALRIQAAPKAAPGEPDGFGSAEHWKEKAQYWAGVAHRLRGEALRGEPVDGIVHPPAPQQEAQEPCPSCRNSDIYACTCTFPTSRNAAHQPAPAPLSDNAKDAARYRWLRELHLAVGQGSIEVTIDDRASGLFNRPIYGAALDAAIDTALAAHGGK